MKQLPYYAPQNMDELYRNLGYLTPQSKVIAGGTDLILQLHSGKVEPDALLYLGILPEASALVREQDKITIGAMVDMTTLAQSPILDGSCAALVQAAAHVGSKQIRNKATIGGNIANASPAGDLIVPLWLLEAEVLIAGPQGLRHVPVSELVIGMGKTSLAYNEVIVSFSFQCPKPGVKTGYRKLGSRSEVTISRVGIAARIEWDQQIVQRAEIVLGAVATTPVRATGAEQALEGSCLDRETIAVAGKRLSNFILEINNRPNRFYKAHAAGGVLEDLLAQM